MKKILLFLLLFAPLVLLAQFPSSGNKQRLGYQTTSDGIIWRGVAADTAYKPIGLNYPYFQLDTVNAILRRYIATKGKWQVVGGSGSPTGAAGGDLTGTYPDPTIGNNKIISAYVLDGTLVNADLANQTVDSNKIKNGAIAKVKLDANAVDSTKAENLSPNDLAQTGASTNDVLTWTGTKYAPRAASGGAIPLQSKAVGYGNGTTIIGDSTLIKFHANTTSLYLGVNRDTISGQLIGFGNSITAGVGASSSRYNWVSLVAYGLRLTANNQGLSSSTLMKQTPLNPFSATNAVDRVAGSIPTKSGTRKYIIISYGANDVRYNGANYTAANFQTDYQTVINSILAKGWVVADLMMLSTSYLDSARAFLSFGGNPVATYARQDTFDNRIRLIALANGIKHVDIRTPMRQLGGNTLLSDGVHPNNTGYLVIANTILQALDTVRLEGQSIATQGTVEADQLILNKMPVFPNSFVIGKDSIGRIGLPLNINIPLKATIGTPEANTTEILNVGGDARFQRIRVRDNASYQFASGNYLQMGYDSTSRKGYLRSYASSGTTPILLLNYGGERTVVGTTNATSTTDGAAFDVVGGSVQQGIIVTGLQNFTGRSGLRLGYSGGQGFVYTNSNGPLYLGYGTSANPVIIQGTTNDAVHGVQVRSTVRYFNEVGFQVAASANARVRFGAGNTGIAATNWEASTLRTSPTTGDFEYDGTDWYGTDATRREKFIRGYKGSGTPEASVSAPIGSIFQRSDGGAGTAFYVKESGTGNTGWVSVTTGLIGANPSASIGLSAINGSATTYMRSDGAPALSQSIRPTWADRHRFSDTTWMDGNLDMAYTSKIRIGGVSGDYSYGAQLRANIDGLGGSGTLLHSFSITGIGFTADGGSTFSTPFIFDNNGRFRINSTNINTLSNTLMVNGAALIGYDVTTAPPSNSLVVSGLIGQGTLAPSQELDISGDGYIRDSLRVGTRPTMASNQMAVYDANGWLGTKEQKRDTTIYIDDSDYDFSAAITTAQIASRYNRVIFWMTTTAAAGSDSDITLHTPDANLMQVEYLIHSVDEAGGFSNKIVFGSNNAVDSTNGLVTNYYPSAGDGIHIRAGLRSGVYKYRYSN